MTVASRLSTKGMVVGVLVSVGGMGVNVSVGGAAVNVGISDGMAEGVDNVSVAEAGITVRVEAGAQALIRKMNMPNNPEIFFIYFSHSINFISSMLFMGSRVSLSLRPSRL